MNLTSDHHDNRIVSPEKLLQQLNWRYATQIFDPNRKISESDWKTLEQVLVLSSSSFGLQPWKFFVVTSQDLKDKLHTASWNQRQVKDASHVVVFAIKDNFGEEGIQKYIDRIIEVRGVTPESLEGFKKIMSRALGKMGPGEAINFWATRQVYIALGSYMAAAAMLGIDVCPMEGFIPDKYNEILGLTEKGYRSVVVAATGYRSAQDVYARTPKVRFKTEDVVVRL